MKRDRWGARRWRVGMALVGSAALVLGACVLDRSGLAAGGSGGMGGMTAAGGMAGSPSAGGSGGAPTCETASDCGTDDACISYSCNEGLCEESYAAASTPCGGDMTDQCDGSGSCLLSAGKTCGAPAECFDGFCADSVCCTTACEASCEACDGPGLTAGTCAPQPPAQDFDGECGTGGVCDGDSACADGNPQDALALAGGGSEVVRAVAFDSAGNLIVVGHFEGMVDFGGGTRNATAFDVFIAKYDTQGQHLWDTQFTSTGNAFSYDVTFDANDNVIVAGHFFTSVTIGTNTYNAPDEFQDPFVAQLNANSGMPQWSQHWSGPGRQRSEGVAVAPNGDIFLLVEFNLPLTAGAVSLSHSGGWDVGLLRLNNAGVPQQGWRWGDSSNQFASDLTTDSAGNVILTGRYDGTIDPDPSGLLTSQGDDIWLIKLTGSGAHVFSHDYGSGSTFDFPSRVRVDSADNVILFGTMNGPMDMGGGTLPHYGDADVWLLRLDPSGAHLWSESYGNTGNQYSWGLAIDDADSMTISLNMLASLDMGGDMLAHNGGYDVALAKLAADGTHLWSARYGDMNDQVARSVAAAPDRRLAIGGNNDGTMIFGGITLTSTDTSDADGFWALLNP